MSENVDNDDDVIGQMALDVLGDLVNPNDDSITTENTTTAKPRKPFKVSFSVFFFLMCFFLSVSKRKKKKDRKTGKKCKFLHLRSYSVILVTF